MALTLTRKTGQKLFLIHKTTGEEITIVFSRATGLGKNAISLSIDADKIWLIVREETLTKRANEAISK